VAKRPFPNGQTAGRDRAGRFAPGNRAALGHGGGLAGQVQKLRAELVKAVQPADIRAIAKRLLRDARAGDASAIKTLLAYVLGPPVPSDILERLERLESLATALREGAACGEVGRLDSNG
jgi:hypothetical protein